VVTAVLATLVEGKELLQTVVAATVAGLGVTFAFSVAIWGFGRSIELGNEDRRLAAGTAAAIGALALLAVLAAIAAGIVVMTHK
jgi:prepilin signal peptidase PulO-like enzyme (type II secretory pathway)